MGEDYKSQRDRYIAFSLAAADLLIEVDSEFHIRKAVGATQALLSHLANDLKGQPVTGLFALADRPFARRLLKKAVQYGRIEPCSLHLHTESGKPLLVNMGACYLPSLDNHIFLSLTVLADVMLMAPSQRDEDTGLLGREEFQASTRRALTQDDAPGELKLVRLTGLAGAVRNIDEDRKGQLLGEISSVLRSHALAGQAARLDDEAFGYIPALRDGATDADIAREVSEAARSAGVADLQITPTVMSLKLDTGNLDEESVTRALSYALNSFCRPDRSPLPSLADSLKAAMRDSVAHLDQIRTLIDDRDFTLHYQPVVGLKERTVHHYEALMRFKDGRSPYETIRLSEELGLINDLDLAACTQAIARVNAHPDASIAVNLSGLSVQNEAFRDRLRALVLPHTGLHSRLMFELTESSVITDIDSASQFMKWLRRTGFSIALDDFGAGASAYSYLRQFDVDFLKVDGGFLKEANDNARQRALVRSICTLCKELGTETIGEMIETEPVAQMCVVLGLDYGQGYLFGRPLAAIPNAAEDPAAVRRKGFVESWQ